MRIIKLTMLIMLGVMVAPANETTPPKPPDRSLNEIEELRLDKSTAEMVAIQAQFQLVKQQEEQLQQQFATRQGEFARAQEAIFERLKLKKEDYSLQQKQVGEKKVWTVVEVEKQRPAAQAAEIEKTKQINQKENK